MGDLGIGGENPIRIQSMVNTDTTDIKSSCNQIIALEEAGCEIVRLTVPSIKDAEALPLIRKELKNQNCKIPLVADIHFTPSVAMKVVEHVEKVRINPGNFADKKKFLVQEYNDKDYMLELERIADVFLPLVKRCKELGVAMRIGTNHGSLSDRIMNRYGDTPLGMCESALEFIRIAESEAYYDIIVSMKSSNPTIMIQAYRLLSAKFLEENRNYPFHLGVTEAGDGTDGRIKSALGIGSLLAEGIGDTIRVSLTEDPVLEIPAAKKILAPLLEKITEEVKEDFKEFRDPFNSHKIETQLFTVRNFQMGGRNIPRIETTIDSSLYRDGNHFHQFIVENSERSDDRNLEIMHFLISEEKDLQLVQWYKKKYNFPFSVELSGKLENKVNDYLPLLFFADKVKVTITNRDNLPYILGMLSGKHLPFELSFIDFTYYLIKDSLQLLNVYGMKNCILSLNSSDPLMDYRKLGSLNGAYGYPILLNATYNTYDDALFYASSSLGSMFIDGLGDSLRLMVPKESPHKLLSLSYDLLQAVRLRTTKTEYISCPSCGRTLFDLQNTTARIKAKTSHLKGVKIAVMGCIVNGPGEMADADFGYVGAGPGKVHLYRNKTIVKKSIPSEIADDELIKLIQSEGMWIDL